MSSVNVRSIEALLDLKHALARYAHEVIPPLDALMREAERTLEWLAERRRYWQRQVEERRKAMQATQAALAQCEATVYRDQRGNVSRPDCSGLRAALGQAVHHLREVEAELRKTDEAKRAVEHAYEDFRRQRQHFQNYLGREGVQSQAFLERRAASLRAYAATSLAGATPGGYSVTAPTDALAGIFTLGIVAGAVGLTSLAVSAIRKMAGHLQTNLGDTGEVLIEQMLAQEPGWQALPFDQPKHGFDRVFSAPGLPVIVVECKVNRRGELHLGQTQDGEQASPQWIAARAAEMVDPTSAQYSPNNAAIAALVEELGPENVPTVVVVIATETGAVGIHYRAGGATTWEQLPEGTDLRALLQTVESTLGQPGSEWVEQGIETVSVQAMPVPEGIEGDADFHKVSAEEMRLGLQRLQEMLPVIETGTGAESDYWRQVDADRGLAYADGYQRVYDAFYGMDAIRVTLDGEKADIINGRHRIWLAQEMGIERLPMHVTRRATITPTETTPGNQQSGSEDN